MSRAELQMVRESVGKLRTEGTYLNLSHADRNLHEFVKDKGVQDILIGAITKDLFEEYRFYLKKRGLKGTTINNYLCWLSRLMYRAVSQNIIRCNPFENAKYEKEDKNIRYLQKYDVARLMAMRMNDSEAEQARLMFIFSCFTGLAIADMETLQQAYPNRSGRTEIYPQGATEDQGGVCRTAAPNSGNYHQPLQESKSQRLNNRTGRADDERKRRRLCLSS